MGAEQDRHRPPLSRQTPRLSGGRWSVRAQRLLEQSCALCVDFLHEPLRRCLGEFDQQLFTLAEQAHRPSEQQECFVSRQRVQQERTALEQRFATRIVTAFDEIDTTAPVPLDNTATWPQLELLDPVEHELNMALEQIGARAEARHSSVLYELGYRTAVLIGAPPLEGKALPLGPHALAQAFHHASMPLDLPLAHQLLLLQSFDQRLIQSIATLLDAVNTQLQADGILPHLRSMPVPRHIQTRTRTVAETAPETHASEAPREPIAVLESLRDLLAQRRTVHDPASGQPVGRAASPEELQTALGALQQHLADVTDHASRELRSAQRLRDELLTQLNAGLPSDAPRTHLSSEQGDTVELVAMLFEQIGEQLQRNGNARALIGDLQLPLLRMAMTDRDFFEQHEHPARQLLDTVTATANEWLDGSDNEGNRPLAAKLEQLVSRAKQEPPSAGLYASLLADIKHHVDLLNRKALAAEHRHVEAVQGRERLDRARQRATELMAERFAQSSPRGLLRALLDRAWSDVLALTLLRHGEQSEAFAAQLAITDQLLGRLPTHSRNQLQQDVETGLQQIGMHAEEAEQVAQRLLGSDAPAVELPSATDLAVRLKQHQRLGQPSDGAPPAVAPAPAPAAVNPREQEIQRHLRQLPFGSWFEFVDPHSRQVARRKLSWYSPMSGRCLFVTRRGQRGQEMTLVQQAHEIANDRVREMPLQRESLLDRAWRGLTGNLLRQSTPPTRATAQGVARP